MSETLGKVTWTYHDAWNADTPYQPLSVVYHKGSSWVSKKTTQNEEPDVLSASWGLVALGYSLVSSFTIQDGGGAQIQRQILMFGDGFSIIDYPAQNMIKIESTGGSGGVVPEHNHDGVNSAKIDYNNLLNIPAPYEYSIGAGNSNKLPKILNFTGDYWTIQSTGTQTLKIGIDLSSMTSEHTTIRGLITQLDQRITNLPNTLQLTTGNITNFPTAMTPIAHGSTHGANGSDPIIIEKSQISDFPTVMIPTAHKDTHKTGGSDALAPADIGAMAERPNAIEMGGWTGGGGLIDFHFNNDTTVDFTSRIGEFTRGIVTIANGLSIVGNLFMTDSFWINNKKIPLSDTGRIALPLAAGWTLKYQIPAYRKVGQLVELSGNVSVPSGAADQAIIGTLPTGYRPMATKFIPIVTSLGIGRIDIGSDGAIRYRSILPSNPAYVDFSCVMFHIN